jgi:hypothetical protein
MSFWYQHYSEPEYTRKRQAYNDLCSCQRLGSHGGPFNRETMEQRGGMFSGGPWVPKGHQARDIVDAAISRARQRCELEAAEASNKAWQTAKHFLNCTLCDDEPPPIDPGVGIKCNTVRELQWYSTSNARTGAHITLCPNCMHSNAVWNIHSPTMSGTAAEPIFCKENTKAEKLYDFEKHERVTRAVEGTLIGDPRDLDLYPTNNLKNELTVAMRGRDIIPPPGEWTRILDECQIFSDSPAEPCCSRGPCECEDARYAENLKKRAREVAMANEEDRKNRPHEHSAYYRPDGEPSSYANEPTDEKMPWIGDLEEVHERHFKRAFGFDHRKGTKNENGEQENKENAPENAPYETAPETRTYKKQKLLHYRKALREKINTIDMVLNRAPTDV